VLDNANAFLVERAVAPAACEKLIQACEALGFGDLDAGKNCHGALQVVVSAVVADALAAVFGPHMEGVGDAHRQLAGDADASFALAGVNRRAPGRAVRAPRRRRLPPGGVSWDDDDTDPDDAPFLHWDATHQPPTPSGLASRPTVLLCLNDDFAGGHTRFYVPAAERGEGAADAVLAAVGPRAGRALVFPQAASEGAVARARDAW
jgi:hypothetical protein